MSLPLNIDIQQILLHMLNFAILAGGLYYLLYKPVKAFMNKRTAFYEEQEKLVKEKLAQAESAKAEYEALLQKADNEIDQMRQSAVEEINNMHDEEIAAAKAQSDKIMKDARKEAGREHDRMIESAQKEIAELASEAAKKLVYSSAREAFDLFLNQAEGSVADDESGSN